MDSDVVVFRRWKDCGSIIALFPDTGVTGNSTGRDMFPPVCISQQ